MVFVYIFYRTIIDLRKRKEYSYDKIINIISFKYFH